MNIPTDRIIPNPNQPRKEFDAQGLEDLAQSIRDHGLINPISVEVAGDHYILIDGERRWRAAKMAGLCEIEASIRPAMNGTGERERLVLAIVANIQRKDMNPIEQALAFKALADQGFTINQVAAMVNISVSQIYNYINLLSLDTEIQDLLKSGGLPFETSGIKALAAIENRDQRVQIAKLAAVQNMSGPAITRLVKRMAYRAPVKRQNETGFISTGQRLTASGGRWNMIAQLGFRPKSEDMARAAEDTCRACQLYDIASNTNCKDCPAVDLLRRLV